MAKLMRVFHLGDFNSGLKDALSAYFDYVNISASDFEAGFEISGKLLFEDGEIPGRFLGDVFVITDDYYLSSETHDFLKKIPAHQIVIDQKFKDQLNNSAKEALYMRDPYYLDFSDIKEVARHLVLSFYGISFGHKMEFKRIKLARGFRGSFNQVGNNYVEVKPESSTEYRKVLEWRHVLPLELHSQWSIRFEYVKLDEKTDLKVRLRLLKPEDHRVYFQQEYENDELNESINDVQISGFGGFLAIEVFTKGENPSFRMGQVHVRRRRENQGILQAGEKELIAKTEMRSNLLCHFEPGDLKPPLNVYFSGYRPNEGIEGIPMMRRMQSPALFFSDPRLEGGSFYVGEEFRGLIISTIQDMLKKLNFKPHELILSGLSMGTYAALYFSSFLNPTWVIVGKPLTKLGDIAANARINRPNDFDTALDMVQRTTGGIGQENLQKANDNFWDVFANHNHSQTDFAIVYMKDDDYDINAFEDISTYLHEHSPESRIIHKGLVGRHNDNTNEIVRWFQVQYRNALTASFGRTFELK